MAPQWTIEEIHYNLLNHLWMVPSFSKCSNKHLHAVYFLMIDSQSWETWIKEYKYFCAFGCILLNCVPEEQNRFVKYSHQH